MKARFWSVVKRLARSRWKPYLFIVVFTLLACAPMAVGRLPRGADIVFHRYRFKGTIAAILDGQLVPQLDPNALGGYGHSWNLFYGPLPTYLADVLRAVIPSWRLTLCVFLILVMFCSAIAMFEFMRDVSGRMSVGLIASSLVTFAPFHLMVVYSRQAEGELVAAGAIPLLFWGLWRIMHGRRFGISLVAAAGTIMLLSHNVTTVLSACFAALFLLLYGRSLWRWPVWRQLLAAGGVILGLTAFFWVPLIEAQRMGDYAVFDPSFAADSMWMSGDTLANRVSSVGDFFWNGTINSSGGPVRPALGAATVLLVLALILLIRQFNRSQRVEFTRWGVLLVLALVSMTAVFPWRSAPSFLLSVQFPWRMAQFALFFASMLAAFGGAKLVDIAFPSLRSPIWRSAVIILIVVVSSAGPLLFGWHRPPASTVVNDQLNHSQSDNVQEIATGVGFGEYLPLPIARDPGLLLSRQPGPRVLSGKATVSHWGKTGSHAAFDIVTGDSPALVELPLTYYPGYAAILERNQGGRSPLTVRETASGFVGIEVPSHLSGKVRTRYGLTWGTRGGALVTAGTLAVLALGRRRSRRIQELGAFHSLRVSPVLRRPQAESAHASKTR